jgi:hypothetical protein
MSDNARYYFDVRDGDYAGQDREGIDFPSVQSALTEATQAIGDMARDQIRKHPSEDRSFAIDVRDDDGPVLAVKMTFTVVSRR